MIDIVLPNNNETEFIDIASRLGIKKLCFLYDFNYYNEEKVQQIFSMIKNRKNLHAQIGFLVNQKNIRKASKSSKLLVAKSSDNDRFFIEGKKVHLIYGFEELQMKDSLHQRSSGLNHTICELAKKNKIAVGFAYSLLLNKEGYNKSILVGRIMQNIKLCQKYKVKTIIGSFSEKPFDMRSPHDVTSLFAMLGIDGKKAKESLDGV